MEQNKCGSDGKTMWCYCGKCKQEDYKLPKDYEKLRHLTGGWTGGGYKVTSQDLLNQAYDEFLNVCEKLAGDSSKTGVEVAIAHQRVKNLVGITLENAIREAEKNGRKLEHEKCNVGCPYYSSGHSISADGSCNMGCC